MDYATPLMVFTTSFSEHHPIFDFIRTISQSYFRTSIPPSSPVHIIISSLTFFSCQIVMSMNSLMILVIANPLIVLYLWTKFITPFLAKQNLRWKNIQVDLKFDKTIQIYHNLTIMTTLQSDFLGQIVPFYFHHVIFLVISILGLYHAILQCVLFANGNQISVVVILICVVMITSASLMEWFIVSFLAKASSASRKFIGKMLYNHGNDKVRRRVVKSLLPNSINLEYLGSVETIRRGIEMDYFLNYVSGVMSHTITLLLATK